MAAAALRAIVGASAFSRIGLFCDIGGDGHVDGIEENVEIVLGNIELLHDIGGIDLLIKSVKTLLDDRKHILVVSLAGKFGVINLFLDFEFVDLCFKLVIFSAVLTRLLIFFELLAFAQKLSEFSCNFDDLHFLYLFCI